MQITGKIHEIGQVQNITDKFKKRDIVIEYAENPQYPEYIRLEATQDKVSLFDKFNVGDNVEVFFNLRGRAVKGNYFNSLVVWRIAAAEGQEVPTIGNNGGGDDLPF